MFSGKVLLITGGTGSFGNAVLRRILKTEIAEIRIFSRDEKKQDDMRHEYRNDKLKFYIGDVRNPEGLRDAMAGVDYVFHAAALKQVPSCEFYPMEAVQHECDRRRQHAHRRHWGGGRQGRGAEHGQGGLSDQRHGHVQGTHGEAHDREVAGRCRQGVYPLRARGTET